MDVTVAICTRNRANSLARTLESLRQMTIPDGLAWEVVVVDNASRDATPAVLRDFAAKLPLRAEKEPVVGLSRARNRAVAAARGDWLVWTDDDVLVDANWLAAYVAAFRRWPDAAVFGGKVLPLLEPPTPDWFRAAQPLLGYLMAQRDFGDAPLPLCVAEGRVPFGANYAVRMQEQRGRQYDPDLGPGSASGRLGEETGLIDAILGAGGTGWWLPDAVVRHSITAKRQKVGYVFSYFRAHGVTAGFSGGADDVRLLFGVPRWLWRRLAVRFVRYHASRLYAPPQVWVKCLIDYAFDRGLLAACLR